MQVIIIAGQSNAGERGTASEVAPEDQHLMIQPANVRLFSWNDFSPYYEEKFFADSPSFGVERIVANLWADANPTKELWILKCSLGGSGMDSWLPGQPVGLYANMILSYQSLVAGKSVILSHTVWIQGEHDSWRLPEAEVYSDNLVALQLSIRQDTGFGWMKFLVPTLSAPYPDRCGFAMVVQAQMDLAWKGRLCFPVTTAGLSKQDDLHYDSSSIVEIGKRIFGLM